MTTSWVNTLQTQGQCGLCLKTLHLVTARQTSRLQLLWRLLADNETLTPPTASAKTTLFSLTPGKMSFTVFILLSTLHLPSI